MIAIAAIALFTACQQNKGEQAASKSETKATWTKIEPQDIENPIHLFAERHVAIATGQGDSVNAMTVSHGSIGQLWRRPVISIYISSSRYTHELLMNNEYFTVNAFPGECDSALQYLGTHSGRDGNKLSAAASTLERTGRGNPTFREANLVIECRKIYAEPFVRERLDSTALSMLSNGTGMHTMFVGEIVNVMQRK
jgi:flavin reductase (DIM6/NTAB) family NADH-FMN oxidoreductase RutF